MTTTHDSPAHADDPGHPGGLNTELNLSHPDDFYEALIDMHRDLSAEQSQLVNAKLILLLSNQIGDLEVLRQAMRLARQGAVGPTCAAGETSNANQESS